MTVSPAVGVPEADGATVFIWPNGLPSDQHFRPDQTSYYVRVQVYSNDGGSWGQVAANGSLHVLILDADASVTPTVVEDPLSVTVDVEAHAEAWVETAVIPFSAPASSVVVVRIPNEAIDGVNDSRNTLVRVYVVLEDGRTSQHSVAKNEAIRGGHYDEADLLDAIYAPGVST